MLFILEKLESIEDQALLPFNVPRPSRKPSAKSPSRQGTARTNVPYVSTVKGPTFEPGKPHYWYGFVWPPTKEPTAKLAPTK